MFSARCWAAIKMLSSLIKHHPVINIQCSCLWARAHFVHMRAQKYAFIMLCNLLGCFVKLALVWCLDFSTIYWQWKTRVLVTIWLIFQEQKWKHLNDKVQTISIFGGEKYLLHKISLAYTLSTVLHSWKTMIQIMINNSVCYYYWSFLTGGFSGLSGPVTHSERWFSVTTLCKSKSWGDTVHLISTYKNHHSTNTVTGFIFLALFTCACVTIHLKPTRAFRCKLRSLKIN